MPTATMTSKGQVTVPAEVRAKLGLSAGSRVLFEELPDGSYRVRARRRDIRELYGMLQAEPGFVATLEQMDDAVAEGAAQGL